MPDFFETDEIVKGFDSLILKRIFSYVKPYKKLMAIAAISLLFATATELLLPLIIKNVMDEALVASWIAVKEEAEPLLAKDGLSISADAPRMSGNIYIRESSLKGIPEASKRRMQENNLLDYGPYYVTELADGIDLPEKILKDVSSGSGPGSRPGLRPIIQNSLFVAPLSYMEKLSPADAKIVRDKDRKTVVQYTVLFFIVLCLALLSSFGQAWSANYIGQHVMVDLRRELFLHTSRQSMAFLSRQPVGRLVTRLSGDVETINEFFTSVVVSFIKDASIMAGSLSVLFVMSPGLGFVTLLTLPPVFIATAIFRRKARDAFRRQRTWLSKVNSFIAEHIAGVVIVKLFGKEKASAEAFKKDNAELMKANLGEMYIFAIFRPLIELFSYSSIAAVLWYGTKMHHNGLISLGALIAFVNLIRMFYSPLQDISEKYTLLQSAMAGGERVFQLLDTDNCIEDKGTHSIRKTIKSNIEFDHVWFAYKAEDWVLKDISFSLEAGKSLAIVGYSGAGKSTIGALLNRMWDPQKGVIRLDGVNIRDIPVKDLRSTIQPVMQDVFIFSGSIAGNIALGRDISMEQIEKAARTVHAHEFIEQLPQGYETVLGEGAASLSSGQRQLLSFARAVAHEPSIVVLDEATSSVDTETEQLLQKGLAAIMQERTTIAIAHRLSTIKNADQILVINDGRVAEYGNHDSLIKAGGIYFNLYNLQYQGELISVE